MTLPDLLQSTALIALCIALLVLGKDSREAIILALVALCLIIIVIINGTDQPRRHK